MTIRSTPLASSNFALIPVPAPAPMIGTPASMFFRSRPRTCSRVNVAMLLSSLLSLRDQFKHHRHRFLGKGAVVDVAIQFDDGNLPPHAGLDRVEHRRIRGAIFKLLAVAVENRYAAQRNEKRDRAVRGVGFF